MFKLHSNVNHYCISYKVTCLKKYNVLRSEYRNLIIKTNLINNVELCEFVFTMLVWILQFNVFSVYKQQIYQFHHVSTLNKIIEKTCFVSFLEFFWKHMLAHCNVWIQWLEQQFDCVSRMHAWFKHVAFHNLIQVLSTTSAINRNLLTHSRIVMWTVRVLYYIVLCSRAGKSCSSSHQHGLNR